MRATRTAGVAIVFFLWLLPDPLAGGTGPAGPEERPGRLAEIRHAYGRLSGAVRAGDLGAFMSAFDRDFIHEARDGSSLDRGPWRRDWELRFEERLYERAGFEIEQVLEERPDRVVLRARRVVVWRERRDGLRELEEAVSVDTWVRDRETWRLRYQLEKELRAEGVLAAGQAPESPRLGALLGDLEAGKAPDTARLWEEVEGRVPLVEAIPGDEAHRRVTFLWRNRGGEVAVALEGAQPREECARALRRLGATDLWYRTERLPAAARFTYRFRLEKRVLPPAGGGAALLVESVVPDPLNPRRLEDQSLAVLPAAAPLFWEGEPGAGDAGTLRREPLQSAVLEERRVLSVYRPALRDGAVLPPRAVVLLDEGTYTSRRLTAQVLDRLIATGRIPPLVAVLVHSEGSQSEALEVSARFVRFLAEELVPWVREHLGAGRRREDLGLGGRRAGGALAAWCGLEHPELWGGVLVHCGALEEAPGGGPPPAGSGAWLARRALEGPARPARFHLEVGVLEPAPRIAASLHLHDVLAARGYEVSWGEFPGDGNVLDWHLSLSRALEAFASR